MSTGRGFLLKLKGKVSESGYKSCVSSCMIYGSEVK